MNIDSDNILRPTYNEKGGERTGEGGLLQSVLQLHERIFELRWELYLWVASIWKICSEGNISSVIGSETLGGMRQSY
jgi:hypothetical protein